jgi:hypothetical protein
MLEVPVTLSSVLSLQPEATVTTEEVTEDRNI